MLAKKVVGELQATIIHLAVVLKRWLTPLPAVITVCMIQACHTLGPLLPLQASHGENSLSYSPSSKEIHAQSYPVEELHVGHAYMESHCSHSHQLHVCLKLEQAQKKFREEVM